MPAWGACASACGSVHTRAMGWGLCRAPGRAVPRRRAAAHNGRVCRRRGPARKRACCLGCTAMMRRWAAVGVRSVLASYAAECAMSAATVQAQEATLRDALVPDVVMRAWTASARGLLASGRSCALARTPAVHATKGEAVQARGSRVVGVLQAVEPPQARGRLADVPVGWAWTCRAGSKSLHRCLCLACWGGAGVWQVIRAEATERLQTPVRERRPVRSFAGDSTGFRPRTATGASSHSRP